ncbi:MAG: heparinase II/III domain-containing protein [Acidimicrobiales bacterium]
MALDARAVPRCPEAEVNAAGRFSFLGEERWLGDEPDWDQSGAERLWRFHLHGFEWAWAFAAHRDRPWASHHLRRLWRSWHDATTVGRGDAWSPFVASLRAWALCGTHALFAGTGDEDDLVDCMSVHAGYLRAHLELDVGGNHLVKNLKALVGLGVFLGDAAVVEATTRRLRHQLDRQVLPDGGHYERSPSYHAQVLGDLVDISGLLAAGGGPQVEGLPTAIASMRGWLGAMLMTDGDVPLFNDCTLVGADRLAALAPAPAPAEPLTVLQPSGYVVVRTGRLHLVADVGLPCPPELPAHAHADCLSFELAVDGRRLVVDTGTSTYRAGPRRAYERSTAAHSTVEVGGADQTEVWGVFRAARRAVPRLEQATLDDGAAVMVASHGGYERLPGRPRHRRTWRVSDTWVEIVDDVTGGAAHRAVARLVLAAGTEVEPLGDGRFRAGPAVVSLTGGTAGVEAVEVARGFGDLRPATSLTLSADGPLPRRLVTRVALG